jgi:hypothetical protein
MLYVSYSRGISSSDCSIEKISDAGPYKGKYRHTFTFNKVQGKPISMWLKGHAYDIRARVIYTESETRSLNTWDPYDTKIYWIPGSGELTPPIGYNIFDYKSSTYEALGKQVGYEIAIARNPSIRETPVSYKLNNELTRIDLKWNKIEGEETISDQIIKSDVSNKQITLSFRQFL